MITKEVVKYLRENLEKGYKLRDLTQALRDAGWKDEDIEEALEVAQGPGSSRAVDTGGLLRHQALAGALTALMFITTAFFGYQYYQKTSAQESKDYSKYTDSLNIDIRSYDTEYTVGETFDAYYYMAYSGEPFTGKILYSVSKEGVENTAYFTTYGELSDIDFDDSNKTGGLSIDLKPFHVGEDSAYSLKEGFDEPGDYTYSISAFSCELLEKNSSKACVDMKASDLIKSEPLKSTSRTITVLDK